MNTKKLMSFAIGPILAAFIGFSTTPFLSWMYSPDNIGLYSILTSIISFSIIFLCIGMDSAYVREYHESNDKKKLFITCLTLPLFNLILAFMGSMIFLTYYADVYTLSKENAIYIVTAIVFATVNRFLSVDFRMKEKAKVYSGYLVLNKLFVFFFLMLFFLLDFEKERSIYYSILLSQVFLFLYLIIFFNKSFEYVPPSKKMIVPYLKYGFPLVISSLSYWAMSSLDKFIISHYLGLDHVGFYSVAQTLGMAFIIFQSILSIIWPQYIYKINSRNKYDAISFASKWINVFLLFSILVLFAFKASLDLLMSIFPEQYHSISGYVHLIFISAIIYTLSDMVSIGINISKRTQVSVIITIISLFVNAIVSIALITKYQLFGVAVGTLVSFTIMFFLKTLASNNLWGVCIGRRILLKLLILFLVLFFFDNVPMYINVGAMIIIILYENKLILSIFKREENN